MPQKQSGFFGFARLAFVMQINKLRHGFSLFDVGSAILFFGVLAQEPQLHENAATALKQLSELGYQIPTENKPLRIFPALTSGRFSGRHAGGWRPGVIYLRQDPQGQFDETVYLRHELFHEANYLTCNSRLPAWAEEAAAMHFSGEISEQTIGAWPSDEKLQSFKIRIREGAELSDDDRRLLGRLIAIAGWPDKPCAISPKLREVLGTAFDQGGDSAYLLMNLQSGRILESGGDQHSRLPPGSLLKLIYAASLSQANPDALSTELAMSDARRLLQRRADFRRSRYRLLLSPMDDKRLARTLDSDPNDWDIYLGGRDADGRFLLEADLPELALAMRAALLSQPNYFKGLTANGTLPKSTLFGQSEADKRLLRQMQVMAKTGTVSTADGRPLAGHLLLAWPAPHPVFLAIFRHKNQNGAANLPKAATLLKQWQKNYPPRFASARVHLLSLTKRDSWEAQAECPELADSEKRFTVCGEFRIVSSAKGSRSERIVRGILYETANSPVVLETDLLSYVDAVLAAEAQNLPISARQALRAVIAWNAVHGRHRHPESSSLCDTTHCMVFLGDTAHVDRHNSETIDIALLKLLDDLANKAELSWLPFAAGGDERWHRQIPIAEVGKLFKESRILDIRRERRKNGDLYIRLYYPDNEESIRCEIFLNTLRLPSCPDRINIVTNRQIWEFHGLGAGHGLGLSVDRAKALATNGQNAEQILIDAFQSAIANKRLVKSCMYSTIFICE